MIFLLMVITIAYAIVFAKIDLDKLSSKTKISPENILYIYCIIGFVLIQCINFLCFKAHVIRFEQIPEAFLKF